MKPKPKPPTGAKTVPSAAPAAPLLLLPDYHLLFTFETYTLPQAELNALHDREVTPAAFYEEIRQLNQSGKAVLELVSAVPTRSGQRSANESHDELMHPTEFQPAAPGRPFGFPSAYEMYPLGARLELDPVEGSGDYVDLQLSMEFQRLTQFSAAKADPQAEGEVVPIIASRKINTAITCRYDVPALLGTVSLPRQTGIPGANEEDKVSVTFVRYRYGTTGETPAEKEAPAPADADIRNLRFVFRCYSLPRGKARDLLAETADADLLQRKLAAMPSDEVKLEQIMTLIGRSGQRSSSGGSGEWRYGVEVHKPERDQAAFERIGSLTGDARAAAEKEATMVPAAYSNFETRLTGWRVELEPILGADGRQLEVNIAPELVTYRGPVAGHPLLARYPQMPVFAVQKISTAVTAQVGHQCLLGTLNPPHDTGVNDRKDDGRTWLLFMKGTHEP